jgi:flagellar assembly protein FliH
MGLIKSANAPVAMIPFSMRDIENQARTILLRAREQAEALLQDAQVEADKLKKAAGERGFIEGKRDGLAKGLEEGRMAGAQQALSDHRAQLTQVIKTLAQSAGELDASRRALEATALADVVKLAIAVARRVTKRQGLIDPDVLTENLSEAMKLVIRAADVRIALHPDQKQVLADALPRLQMKWPALQHVELIEDPLLAPGGCRIYSHGGEVDADLDGQLDRVVADLLPAPAEPAEAR